MISSRIIFWPKTGVFGQALLMICDGAVVKVEKFEFILFYAWFNGVAIKE